jgi:hypothetical protein
MQKIIVTYRLRPGVTLKQYKAWSCAADQRITSSQPGVIRFEVYAVEGAQDGKPHCDIVEDIDVDSYEAFARTLKGPGMRYCAETFPKYVDVSTVRLVYGSRIVEDVPSGFRPRVPRVGAAKRSRSSRTRT